MPVLIPIGCNENGVGIICGFVAIVDELDGFPQDTPRAGNGDGVVRDDLHAALEGPPDHRQRRGLANVVGIRLEGQTENADALSGDAADRSDHIVEHALHTRTIDLQHGGEQPRRRAAALRDVDQR